MRLVIDLQSCQHADTLQTRETLALVTELLVGANGREVYIAFSNQFPARLEVLRAAFPSLPREYLVVYDTPSPSGAARVQRGIELIRDNFFAALGADVVFAPHMFAAPLETIGTVGAGLPFITAISITPPALLALQAGETEPNTIAAAERRNDSLAYAGLLVASVHDHSFLAESLDNLQARLHAIADDPAQAAQDLWQIFSAAHARRPVLALPDGRPLLAYVSPLPPQQSGIADYSAELIAELDAHYEVHLIVPVMLPFDPAIAARFQIHTVEWFEQNAHRFGRILYHFGNSVVHQFMFDLLVKHPGIVVLHDFYLGNVIDYMEYHGGVTEAYSRALLASHGYTGLITQIDQGRVAAIWEYPVNQPVLDNAIGVIVHSAFAIELSNTWYGRGSAARWNVLPLLRGTPESGAIGRAAARSLQGMEDDDFVICSFGMLGATKLNDRLLTAFLALPPHPRKRCRLVFVGGDDPSAYGDALKASIARSGKAGDISITGFVDAEHYRAWLQVADVAVQLRARSRGETSASVLDCLLYGAATIVNAHGANAELPVNVVSMLADEFNDADLLAALTFLLDDEASRRQLSDRGRAHVQQHHNPKQVGRLYAEAIERLSTSSPQAHYRSLLESIVATGAPTDARHYELVAAATAIAANQPATQPRQMFVDISAMVQSDLKTGIQRVVRSVLTALLRSPPAGFRIEPVYSLGANQRYRYARRFTLDMIGASDLHAEDTPIEHRSGDVFLGLDLAFNCTAQNQALLTDMRHRGISIYFVIYDLLPLLMPEAFPLGMDSYFRDYVDVLARLSDGLLCISRAVADELTEWIAAHCAPRRTPLSIGYFHLGADISASIPSFGLPDNALSVLDAVAQRPTLLMVGTVEPRKGHEQTLQAFELLWQRGIEVNLVIVGKGGWMVDALLKNLHKSPQLNKQLFWLSGVSDEMLTKLYENASGLLAASVGEGFGLPLIEAAQHGLPIIARNLPVFQEVSGEHAFYFDGADGASLATALATWLALYAEGKAPPSTSLPWLTWSQSAQQLLDAIIDGDWYHTLPPGTDL